MRNIIIIFCIICSAIALISCENLNEPGTPKFNNSVFLNFSNGISKQKLFVFTVVPVDFQLIDYSLGHVGEQYLINRNASIQISDNSLLYNDFIYTHIDKPSFMEYFTNNSFLEIKPETDYKIMVESNNQIITGSFKSLGNLNIFNISKKEFDAEKDLINFTFNIVANSKFYYLYLSRYTTNTRHNFSYWSTVYPIFNLDVDTLADKYFFTKSFKIDRNDDSVKISIKVYDQNNYDYFIRKIKQVGVENAYGFVGSFVQKDTVVVFNKKTAVK